MFCRVDGSNKQLSSSSCVMAPRSDMNLSQRRASVPAERAAKISDLIHSTPLPRDCHVPGRLRRNYDESATTRPRRTLVDSRQTTTTTFPLLLISSYLSPQSRACWTSNSPSNRPQPFIPSHPHTHTHILPQSESPPRHRPPPLFPGDHATPCPRSTRMRSCTSKLTQWTSS